MKMLTFYVALFSKDSLYLNCDLYSSFPISTFITLLKPGQTVFAGNISSDVTTSSKKKNINYFDFLKDEKSCLIQRNANG